MIRNSACRGLKTRTWGVAALLLLVGSAGSLVAEEPASEFLKQLRERAYFDLANEYLERMEKSPLVSPEFRETIAYEQGLTLIAVSRGESDFTKRQARLDEAQKKFQQFLNERKSHDLAPKAQSELANVLVERARVKVTEAKRPQNSARKADLMKEAKAFFDEAHKAFLVNEEVIRKKIEEIPKALDPQKDAKRIEYRDSLRADYITVQIAQAVLLYEMAETALDKKTKDEMLKKAADAYGSVYEKYRRRLAGMYARLSQGRCYQEMGGEKNLKEAIAFYQELLEQPDQPDPFRVLRTKTLIQSMQCWLDPAMTEKKIDQPIQVTAEWVSKMRPNEDKDPDWLKLHYELARAYKAKIDQLQEKDPNRNRIGGEGKKIVEHGVRHADGDLKSEFQAMLPAFGGVVKPAGKVDPKTFAEAFQAGKDALETIQSTGFLVTTKEGELAKTKDAAERKKIEEEIAASKKLMVDTRFDAIKYFNQSLQLVDPDTSLDDVNNSRYFLCYLYYTDSSYYDAGVMGEFVARNFPSSAGARNCAKIALASFLNLYREETDIAKKAEREPQTQFESQHVQGIAEFIIAKWPDEKEAQDALITVIKFKVMEKNLDEAEKYLAKIPVDSPRRGEAELTTGQAMWSTYLQGLNQLRKWELGTEPIPAGVSLKSRGEELDAIKQRAQKTLRDGITRMKEKGIDPTLATAVLSLCQILVDSEQAQEAIKLLEDPEIGARTLVEKNHEAASRAGYAEETYKTSLRAYIGALPGSADKTDLMAKADGVMDLLSKTVPDTDEGREKLLNIYLGLANDVEQQITTAAPENKQALTEGFATFLDRVGQTAKTFSVQNWVAENFFTIGKANYKGTGEPSPQVKGYFEKASLMYDKILADSKDDKMVTPQMRTQIMLRMADVRRKFRKHLLAVDLYEDVLKENNSMLNVQVQAAECIQEWGDWGVSKLYLIAIRGGRRDAKSGKYTIWGWKDIGTRLARHMAKNPDMDEASKKSFNENMHKAFFNMADCQYKYAMRQDDAETKKKYLNFANQGIRITQRSYPDLGGEEWRPKYDALLREIQTKLGEKPLGLEAFATENATEKPAPPEGQPAAAAEPAPAAAGG